MKRIGLILFITLFFLTGCMKAQLVDPSLSSKGGIDTAAPSSSQTPVPTEEKKAEPTPTPVPSPKNIAALEDNAKALISEVEKKKEEEAKKKVSPYMLVVDVTNQVVTAYVRDKEGKFTKVVRQMIATTGKSSTKTPLGKFIMPGQKGRWGYFSEFDVYAQYFSRIRGGILFHSVIFAKADESTLVVGSFNNLGNAGSHGCVRLQVQDAKWIYDHAGGGTEVNVVARKSNHALTARLKPAPIVPKVTAVAINVVSPFTMTVGATKPMSVKVTYDNKTTKTITTGVTWSVFNGTAITIAAGTVKAEKKGTATITATLKGIASAPVTVTVVVVPAATPTPVSTATPVPTTATPTPTPTATPVTPPAT